MYELGKSFCKKYQKKNKKNEEKEDKENIGKISFESQMKTIKRKDYRVHSKIYKERCQIKLYCLCCLKVCCEMHFGYNGICYICNGFDKHQIIELDEQFKKQIDNDK